MVSARGAYMGFFPKLQVDKDSKTFNSYNAWDTQNSPLRTYLEEKDRKIDQEILNMELTSLFIFKRAFVISN